MTRAVLHAAARGFVQVLLIDGVGRPQTQIRCQHFRRLQIHRRRHASDEESDARQCGHGDRQRKQQHTQLAGTPLAPERSRRRMRARGSFHQSSRFHPQDPRRSARPA